MVVDDYNPTGSKRFRKKRPGSGNGATRHSCFEKVKPARFTADTTRPAILKTCKPHIQDQA